MLRDCTLVITGLRLVMSGFQLVTGYGLYTPIFSIMQCVNLTPGKGSSFEL